MKMTATEDQHIAHHGDYSGNDYNVQFTYVCLMYISKCFVTFFLLFYFPCISCGRVTTLFSNLIPFVYICVPMPSKAPKSSKKGFLHPTISVRFDRGKLSAVV